MYVALNVIKTLHVLGLIAYSHVFCTMGFPDTINSAYYILIYLYLTALIPLATNMPANITHSVL